MAVKLRLMRMGKKKQPTYRVVAADSRSPRDGRFLEILGTYAPRSEPSEIVINLGRVQHWLSLGAQPTETVTKLLRIAADKDDSPEANKIASKMAATSKPAAASKAATS